MQYQMTMRIGEQQSNISMPAMVADQSMKHQMLSREEWFHGPISRKDAEQLLLEVQRTQYYFYCVVNHRTAISIIPSLNATYIILFFLQDGDFLVRESQGSPGQYVLTGMQSNSKKHLLLVDPEGIVSICTCAYKIVLYIIPVSYTHLTLPTNREV